MATPVQEALFREHFLKPEDEFKDFTADDFDKQIRIFEQLGGVSDEDLARLWRTPPTFVRSFRAAMDKSVSGVMTPLKQLPTSGIEQLDILYRNLQLDSSPLLGVVEEFWPQIVRALDKEKPVSEHFKSRRNHALEVFREVTKRVDGLDEHVKGIQELIRSLKEVED